MSIHCLVTTHMEANAQILQSVLPVGTSMDRYPEDSLMQQLTVWATEIEIVATASIHNTTIYTFASSGPSNNGWNSNPRVKTKDEHSKEAIYLITALAIIFSLWRKCNYIDLIKLTVVSCRHTEQYESWRKEICSHYVANKSACLFCTFFLLKCILGMFNLCLRYKYLITNICC